MEKPISILQLVRGLALIVLSCAPLMYLVHISLADISAQDEALSVLTWDQLAILVASLVFPLVVLPRLGVNWSRERDLG